MRIEDVVHALKERQAKMQRDVFGHKTFDDVSFAREQGRHMGISEALSIIADAMRTNDED